MNIDSVLLYSTLAGVFTLVFSGLLAWYVLRLHQGSDQMKEIALAIKTGANAYLWRQYKVLALVAIILFLVLAYLLNVVTAVGFVIGAFTSALSGYIGMAVAVRSE